MLKKLFYKIDALFDLCKSFLIRFLATVLIICFIGSIVHNVLKMSEISTNYIGDYKRLIGIDGNKMINVYQTGSGEKTIVILPGFGSQAPIIQYKSLVEGLKDSYNIVVIEYYGYGFSMSMNKDRKNETIANEIHTALSEIGVERCTFIAPTTSNLYASKYVSLYPESVDAIISLNGIYPSEIENNYLLQKYREEVKNTKITGIFELTGYARILSYVKPEEFYIDKMKSNSIYTEADIKVYRNRIGSSYLTRPMIKEIGTLEENMKELKNFKYPEYLPVLQILSNETVKEYDSFKNETKKSLKDFANTMVSNSSIQRSVEIKGDKMLEFTAPEETVNKIKEFVMSY